MKKVYIKPKTRELSVKTMLLSSSMIVRGDCNTPPVMGTDGEGEYPNWDDYINFT